MVTRDLGHDLKPSITAATTAMDFLRWTICILTYGTMPFLRALLCAKLTLAFAASPALARDRYSFSERNGTNYTVLEHEETRLEFVKNSGICETTPGVNQYSGYMTVGTDMNMWFWYYSPGFLSTYTCHSREERMQVLRVSHNPFHGAVSPLVEWRARLLINDRPVPRKRALPLRQWRVSTVNQQIQFQCVCQHVVHRSTDWHWLFLWRRWQRDEHVCGGSICVETVAGLLCAVPRVQE